MISNKGLLLSGTVYLPKQKVKALKPDEAPEAKELPSLLQKEDVLMINLLHGKRENQ